MNDTATNYYAVIKLKGSPKPASMEFKAVGVSAAIAEMIRLAGVPNTMEFDEFEILEKLPENQYLRVAVKNPLEPKIRARLTAGIAATAAIESPAKEIAYIPYSLENA